MTAVVQIGLRIHLRRQIAAALLIFAAAGAACGTPKPPPPPPPREVANGELRTALANDDVDALKRALDRGADPNAIGASGDTPLLVAATSGNPALVKALLGAGANVHLRRHGAWDGDTPLYAAAARGHSAVVQVLVEAGANVNVRRGADGTDVHALFWPSYNGNVATVAVLLVNGATVERRDLFAAIEGGHVEVVRRLLQAGGDPRWSSQQFRDVLDAAEHSPRQNRQKMVAVIRLFLWKGAAGDRSAR